MIVTVDIINADRHMVAARNGEENEWVILEVLDTLPEIGDELEHPDITDRGRETYRNRTKGTSIEVAVENVVWSAGTARKHCFL